MNKVYLNQHLSSGRSGQIFLRHVSSHAVRTGLSILTLICLLGITTQPAAAQDASGEVSLLEQLHAARSAEKEAEQISIAPEATPPLPFEQPQVGPVTKVDLPPLIEARPVSGWTGYGHGQSTVGIGREIMTNPDDMDMRSTEIDVSLVPEADGVAFPEVAENERWIRVDVGEQIVVAYEGLTPVKAFVVSTGLPGTPTVTGEFRVKMKVPSQTMSGDDYFLPGVKWVMYFYSEYAFHGSYWHEDFGNTKSHGCVNMTNADAKWLFEWAGPVWDGVTTWYPATADNPGTLVLSHS